MGLLNKLKLQGSVYSNGNGEPPTGIIITTRSNVRNLTNSYNDFITSNPEGEVTNAVNTTRSNIRNITKYVDDITSNPEGSSKGGKKWLTSNFPPAR